MSSHFSWLRTRLSIERTLMSWVRTSTALIGFGFTIFQFCKVQPDTGHQAARRAVDALGSQPVADRNRYRCADDRSMG